MAIELLTALLASALIIQKVVEFARKAFDSQDKVKTFWWSLLALALGVVYALGWELNLADDLSVLVPASGGEARLTGVSGQVLTGLAIGAAAGFWHGVFELLELTAKRGTTTR